MELFTTPYRKLEFYYVLKNKAWALLSNLLSAYCVVIRNVVELTAITATERT